MDARQQSFWMYDEDIKTLEGEAEKQGKSRSKLMRQALREFIERQAPSK